jgi:glutamate/aspartate transport system substrate-binding protein
MTNSKAAIGTLLTALIMAGPAWSQDLDGTLKKIKESSTLTLGYLESAPPFSFPGPDRRPVGYSIDLCHPRCERDPETTRAQSKTQLGAGHD